MANTTTKTNPTTNDKPKAPRKPRRPVADLSNVKVEPTTLDAFPKGLRTNGANTQFDDAIRAAVADRKVHVVRCSNDVEVQDASRTIRNAGRRLVPDGFKIKAVTGSGDYANAILFQVVAETPAADAPKADANV